MKKIIAELFKYQDLEYRDFNSKIIPNIDKEKMIGVRLPILRKMAKEMVNKNTYQDFIKELPHCYFEENMLHSCILSRLNNFDELLIEVEKFLPFIDNWAVCDALSCKIFKENPKIILNRIKSWIKSNDTYTIRFGVVTLLNNYLDDNFDIEINNLVSNVRSSEYYVNMAIAWYFSYALIKQYNQTIPLFEKRLLPKWVHNKALQKAIESHRIDVDMKKNLQKLKWKD